MKRSFVGRISNEALYSYFLSVRVHLSLGKNVTTAMFDNIKYIRNKRLKNVLTDIRYDMFMNGTSFSDAFKVYEKCFPPEIVPLLCMGEATGTMEIAVKSCESLLRMRVETDKAVKNEMSYPMFVMFLVVVAVFLIALLVIPLLSTIVSAESVSNLKRFSVIALCIISAITLVIAVIKLLCKMFDSVGRFFHMVKIYMPIFGKIERAKVTAICALCLDTMLKNGLSGLMIYDMLMRVVPNKYVKANLEESYGSLLDGVPIDLCIRTTKGFSEFFYTIPLVANSVNDDGKSPIGVCAEYSKEEMRSELKKLVSFIQPVMLLAVGLIMMTLFLSVFMPYLDSMQSMLDLL